ncbi:MAG: serine/threonine protein [Planctomycetota bacterium]|nr:MAG: serine/threonine protein [Planctomycetota bacterium]
MDSFRTDLRDRLPLPLARLYRRAFNAKAGSDRHANAFYLLEALLKFAAGAQVAAYLASGSHQPALDKRLAHLALPSLGHWVEFLREISAATASLDPHPFPDIAGVTSLLRTAREDLPATAALLRAMEESVHGAAPHDAKKVRPLDLFDKLVSYRNQVFGHGAARDDAFYARMGPLLLDAAVELLDKVPLLGKTVLVYVAEVRETASGRLLDLWDLTGTDALRATAPGGGGEPAGVKLQAGHLYLKRGASFLDLHPLLVCAADGPEEGVLFLNRSQVDRRVEYLDYVTGSTSPAPELLEDHRRILGRILGVEVTPERLAALHEASLSDLPDPEPEKAPATARKFGDFDLLAKLGEGGMGTVYLARQKSLGRLVGLKLLPPALSTDEIAAARFSREIRALARSDHPNIVRILASGRTEGLFWLAMEYVEGCDLREIARSLGGARAGLRGGDLDHAVTSSSERRKKETTEAFPEVAPLPRPPAGEAPGGKPYFTRLAELFRDAALGLQHLHDRGVIHRDVKPGNIMVTNDGRTVLMDLGLAQIAGEASLTTPAGILGTLKYAAPEQVTHSVTKVDARADVYGLGATLYELATGRPPYEGGNAQELVAKVLYESPPAPRKVEPSVPADLDAVIRKATDRDPGRRYQSAALFSEDLDRLARGEPVIARPLGAFGLLVRRARLHPRTVSVVATLLVVSATLTTWLSVREARQRRAATYLAGAELRASKARLDYFRYHGPFEAYQRELILAAKEAEAAAELDPAWAVPWSTAGACRLEAGEPVAARAAFTRAVAIDPGDAAARGGLAEIFFEDLSLLLSDHHRGHELQDVFKDSYMADLGTHRAALASMKALDPEVAAVAEALQLILENKRIEAANHFEDAARKSVRPGRMWLLACVAWASVNSPEFTNDLNRCAGMALSLMPSDPAALYYRGVAAEFESQDTKGTGTALLTALSSMDECLKRHPLYSHARYKRAWLRYHRAISDRYWVKSESGEQDKYWEDCLPKIAEDLKVALEVEPRNPVFHSFQCMFQCLVAGQFGKASSGDESLDDARRACDKFLEDHPKCTFVLGDLGSAGYHVARRLWDEDPDRRKERVHRVDELLKASCADYKRAFGWDCNNMRLNCVGSYVYRLSIRKAMELPVTELELSECKLLHGHLDEVAASDLRMVPLYRSRLFEAVGEIKKAKKVLRDAIEDKQFIGDKDRLRKELETLESK